MLLSSIIPSTYRTWSATGVAFGLFCTLDLRVLYYDLNHRKSWREEGVKKCFALSSQHTHTDIHAHSHTYGHMYSPALHT